MPNVLLRTRHAVLGHLDWTDDEAVSQHRKLSAYVFDVGDVALLVNLRDRSIAATVEAELSDEAIESLGAYLPSFHPDIAGVVDRLGDAVDRLVDALRFTYPMDLLRGSRLASVQYSTDGSSWTDGRLPVRPLRLGSMSTRQIDDLSRPVIQAQLDAGVRPLIGFRYLQRARDLRDPRQQWIGATIAAELAIKEFLALSVPQLETLLLELPSPPLDKLYGAVLESYSGSRSPWAKHLGTGGTRRNHLIHRHNEPSPDQQHAADYLNIVAAALYDLMVRLHPEDATLRELAKTEAEIVEHQLAQEKRDKAEREKQAKAERKKPPTPG